MAGPFYEAAGRRLKNWIHGTGDSVPRAAERMGMPVTTLRHYLYGTRPIPLDKAERLCAMYGHSLSDLAAAAEEGESHEE